MRLIWGSNLSSNGVAVFGATTFKYQFIKNLVPLTAACTRDKTTPIVHALVTPCLHSIPSIGKDRIERYKPRII